MSNSQALPLHFQIVGSGHPLLILHGLFGSLSNWKPLSKSLAETYQVFLVDQRNHGRSPHSSTHNYQVMAEDVKALMDAQQLDSAYILGHSMGGKTAMQFAVNCPDRVDKLIVVDIAPKAYPPHHDEILDALRTVNLSAVHQRSDLDAQLAARIPDASVRQFLMMNALPDQTGQWKWRLNLDAIYNNYASISQNIEVIHPFAKPTLFIRGERSHYIQDGDIFTIRAIFPQAEIVTIPNAGHWVHVEAAEKFTRIVLEFLSKP